MHLPFLSKNKNSFQKDQEKKKEQYYPVCPNCLSPNLKFVHEYTSGWLTTPRYYCPNCKYSGPLVLEIDIDLLETKTLKELRKMFLEEEFEKIDETESKDHFFDDSS